MLERTCRRSGCRTVSVPRSVTARVTSRQPDSAPRCALEPKVPASSATVPQTRRRPREHALRDGGERERARLPSPDLGNVALRALAWIFRSKYTHGAVIIVVAPDDRLLFVKNRLRDRGRNSLPGGFTKIRETPVASAVRQLRQETGLALPESALGLISVYRQPWAWHYEHLYGVKLTALPGRGVRRRSLEITSGGWAHPDDAVPLTRATSLALREWNGAALPAYDGASKTSEGGDANSSGRAEPAL